MGRSGGGLDIFRRKFIFPLTAIVVGGIGVPNNDTHRNTRYGIYPTVLPFYLVAT